LSNSGIFEFPFSSALLKETYFFAEAAATGAETATAGAGAETTAAGLAATGAETTATGVAATGAETTAAGTAATGAETTVAGLATGAARCSTKILFIRANKPQAIAADCLFVSH
jgi:hypothetical protein